MNYYGRSGDSRIPELDIAYMAGLFDGEGTVACGRTSGRFTALQLSNTDEHVIDWIVDTFGGTKGTAKDDPRANRRRLYRWHISGIQAENLGLRLYPYLIIKRTEMSLWLEARACIRRRQSYDHIIDEILEHRQKTAQNGRVHA